MCGSDDLDTQLAFDRWQVDAACTHPGGLLVQHRIGNIALVAALRGLLQAYPDRFPMLLARVLYNGIHCGDVIGAAEVPRLQAEVVALSEVHGQDAQMERFARIRGANG